jgi:hypothetical protein
VNSDLNAAEKLLKASNNNVVRGSDAVCGHEHVMLIIVRGILLCHAIASPTRRRMIGLVAPRGQPSAGILKADWLAEVVRAATMSWPCAVPHGSGHQSDCPPHGLSQIPRGWDEGSRKERTSEHA